MNLARELQDYLIRVTSPFDWAHHNCAHFANAWVRQRRGIDCMAGVPQVGSAKQALRLVRQMGGYVEAVSERLGSQPVPAKQLRLGDLVLYPLAHGAQALGIVAGRQVALLDQQAGLVFLPLPADAQGWSL